MQNIMAVALTTYRESVRSKILYSVFFFAIALVLITALFGTVTIGDQVRVIKDFGLMSVSLFPVAFAVIAGAALLHKELSKKTVYNILAKPVGRYEFLCGKYFGMLATTVLMVLLMGVGLMGFVSMFEGRIDWLMAQALLMSVFELIVICAAAIFFSTIVVTPLLSGLFTFGIFLAGRSTEHLLYFIENKQLDGLPALLLKGIYAMLPHLDKLNVSNTIVYGQHVEVWYLASSFAYAAAYAASLLLLAAILFRYREFN